MPKPLLFFLLLLCGHFAVAQTVPPPTTTVRGRIVDAKDQSALIGANVLLRGLAADSLRLGAAADPDGNFVVTDVPAGRYQVVVSFLGYQNLTRPLSVAAGTPVALGTLPLTAGGVALKGVEVVGQAAATVQKGDTTQYNAGSFKTNPDANAQDLITKMPGVIVDPSTGKVQAQGEQVQRVLVDGKEFFGSDPDAVLKNLPAEAIDKIQVYDRKSDQSQFTGFDDGNTTKTINIVTKPNYRNGQFGRVLAGYGPNGGEGGSKYQVSGNLNSFKGSQRLSVVAQSNNVNQQNFGTEDLLGVVGNSGGGRGGRGGGGGGSSAGNFLVSQNGGISTTHAVGLNYSDTWGKKTDVQSSYFFNLSDNTTRSTTNRLYNVLTRGRTLGYDEASQGTAHNINHRFNLRLEHKFDTANSILWQPRLTFQRNNSNSTLDGRTFLDAFSDQPDSTQSANNSRYESDNQGLTLSNQLLYRHRFAKRGRTLSVNLNTSYNTRDADNYLNSLSTDFTAVPVEVLPTNQYSRLDQAGWNLRGNLNYTEPLSLKSQLQLSYDLGYTPNDSDKRTFDAPDSDPRVFNDSLSNVFRSSYFTNAAGLSYHYKFEELDWNVGVSAQTATLDNRQEFPRPLDAGQTFLSVLPNASVRYRFSKQQNLRLNYRTQTQNPSISQLQEVVNNSNQLQITTGNPNLRQEFTHNMFLRYSSSQPETSRSFFALIGGSYVQNSIGNSTTVLREPTTIGGVVVPAGGQITRPINLDNQYSLRTFANYTLPVKPIKSNLNLNASANFSQSPGFVNGRLNYNRAPSFSLGAVLSSNISENLDFTVSSNSTQTYSRNTVQSRSNSEYFRQNTSVRLNWLFLRGIKLETNVNHVAYAGLTAGYNQQYILWNASLGKKLFARQQGEIKVFVFDLLKQNNSISRNITDAYTEDVQTNILQQYAMLMFTYNIRNFKGANRDALPTDDGPNERRGRFGRPEGGPPGGGPPPGGGGGFDGPRGDR